MSGFRICECADDLACQGGASKVAGSETNMHFVSRSGKRLSGKLLFDMRAASAWLLDDETVVLRLQSPANTINIQVIAAVQRSLTEAEQRSSALLLMNAGEDFSLGANLPLLTAWACGGHFQRIRELVDAFQRLTLRMVRSRVPIVCHAFGRVLGGGAELCLASTEVLAEPSARAGLVEVQLGVIPGGGGSVLLLRNALAGLMLSAERERASRMIFDWIFTAHVASCAQEARNIGLLPPTTLILPKRADAFERARARVTWLTRRERVPIDETVHVAGRSFYDAIVANLAERQARGQLSAHDKVIGTHLAEILAGPREGRVCTKELLAREQEAFLSLCGEPKSQARMKYMLTERRALRN